MCRRVAACLLAAFSLISVAPATAADLPDIKASARNVVPECATPGRLNAYLKSRGSEIDSRFDSVATEYMRYGEQLGVRWDYAFFQMIVETGGLTYRRGHRQGDVKPAQNNFAGLGATGKGEPGESFRDVGTGVRAHLEHLLLYAASPVEAPVAERTRKVQEWRVLTSWQNGIKRPINYTDMARKWAPGDKSYAGMIESVAAKFYDEHCAKPDPRPELVAEARGATVRAPAAKPVAEKPERVSGAGLAKQAIVDGKNSDQRSGLGSPAAKPVISLMDKLLNGGESPDTGRTTGADGKSDAAKAESRPDAKTRTTAAAPSMHRAAPQEKPAIQTAAAAGALKAAPPPAPPAAQKCRVWTASYGGQKALIIKSLADQMINYTVLDVNEGSEAREAEAFIAAYAKGGSIAGEFNNQGLALDKAFELCPEG